MHLFKAVKAWASKLMYPSQIVAPLERIGPNRRYCLRWHFTVVHSLVHSRQLEWMTLATTAGRSYHHLMAAHTSEPHRLTRAVSALERGTAASRSKRGETSRSGTIHRHNAAFTQACNRLVRYILPQSTEEVKMYKDISAQVWRCP